MSDTEGQWNLAYDNPWSYKESDTILQLNNSNNTLSMCDLIYFFGLRTDILRMFKPQQFYWTLSLKGAEDT